MTSEQSDEWLFVLIPVMKRERTGSKEQGPGDTAASSPSFEACLKIRGQGIDTACTLDAVNRVLCAATGTKSSIGSESRTDVKSNGQMALGTERDDKGASEMLDDSRQDARVANTPSSKLQDPSGAAGGASDDDVRNADASSSPSLWSLQFSYSLVERVLDALEIAVSGLMFVVIDSGAREAAEAEASNLW